MKDVSSFLREEFRPRLIISTSIFVVAYISVFLLQVRLIDVHVVTLD